MSALPAIFGCGIVFINTASLIHPVSELEGYTKVSIPKELSDKIERYIVDNPDLGYKSIAEFVKEAIRAQLLEREEQSTRKRLARL
jgi:hypothetical protein